MISEEIKIRVGYKDTDAMGVVHHSNYVVYYEIARTEMLRQWGMTYKEMEDRGVMMPVLAVASKYYASARYDDLLTVKVSVKELPAARITFHYEIFDQNAALLNTGEVTLAFVDAATRRPTRAPRWFVELLESRIGAK